MAILACLAPVGAHSASEDSDLPDAAGQPLPATIVEDIPAYADDALSNQFRARGTHRSQDDRLIQNQARQQPAKRAPVVEGKLSNSLRVFSVIARPQGASLAQTMASIYSANPQAFIDGDPNRLKPGIPLKIPSASSIRSLPESEADAILKRFNANKGVTTARAGSSVDASQPMAPPLRGSTEREERNVSANQNPVPASSRIATLEKALAERDAALKAAQERIDTLENQAKVKPELSLPPPISPSSSAPSRKMEPPKLTVESPTVLKWVAWAVVIVVSIVLLVGVITWRVTVFKRKRHEEVIRNNEVSPPKTLTQAVVTDPAEISAMESHANSIEEGYQPEAPLVMQEDDVLLPVSSSETGHSGVSQEQSEHLIPHEDDVFLPVSSSETGHSGASQEQSEHLIPYDGDILLPVSSSETGYSGVSHEESEHPILQESTLYTVESDIIADDEPPFELAVDMQPSQLPELDIQKTEEAGEEHALLTFDFEPHEKRDSVAEREKEAPLFASNANIDAIADGNDPMLDRSRLDLVQVYLDMGDKQGAREVLEDILISAKGEIKARAESLLAETV